MENYYICRCKKIANITPLAADMFATVKVCSESATNFLLYLVNDGLESLWVVDSEVSEHLAVDLDTCLVEQTHEL